MPTSFTKIFAELEAALEAGVILRYGVGGAIGATFYVEAAETEGVDVFIAVDSARGSPLDPFRAVFDYFRNRGAGWQDEHLVIGGWPVHFLPSTGGLVDDALEHARMLEVEGQQVRVLSLEHLAAIAVETKRAKNRIRMHQIWESPELDRQRFGTLIANFGLAERWTRWLDLLEEEGE